MMPTAQSIRVQVSLYEALGFHEAFRRLGYPPADIFIAVHPNAALRGAPTPWCVLKSVLLPRPVCMSLSAEAFSEAEQAEFLQLWPVLVEAWNTTMSDDERRRIWLESYVANNASEFSLKMVELGHRAPVAAEVFA